MANEIQVLNWQGQRLSGPEQRLLGSAVSTVEVMSLGL